jgi:carbonic anhydrase/acetyltransferase-like protein (isoleucine patch superfamily)
VLENSVVVGARTMPTTIGRRTTFGHRCLVIGATVGNLCEIGNGSILMPGARVGDTVFLGEGTLVPPGMVLHDGAVAVGRPARVIRTANEGDMDRLRGLREGDLSLPDDTAITIGPTTEAGTVAQLYDYRGIMPTIAASAVIFPSAEITGDVVVGEGTIIGAGVKIIGDSHGPVRIGRDVQILENTVLHLLPDNTLVIDDGAILGPGAMIHGCHRPGPWSNRARSCATAASSAPTRSCGPGPSSSSDRTSPTAASSTASRRPTSVRSRRRRGRRGRSTRTSSRAASDRLCDSAFTKN